MREDLARTAVRLQAQGNWSEAKWEEVERWALVRPSLEDYLLVVVSHVTQNAFTAHVVEQMAEAEIEFVAGGPWLVRA